jgi:hypothetical protein
MLFLVMLLTACQPDTQAVSAEILAAPEFQAAVDAAAAKREAESTPPQEENKDVGSIMAMAECLTKIRKSPYSETTDHTSRKSLRRCGRIGVGTEDAGQ